MNPGVGQVHVDAPLTNISIAEMNSPGNFIAQQVFPRVPVKKRSDKYFIYNADFLFRSKTEVRAPGSEVALRNFKVSTSTYSADEFAVGMLIPDEVQENSDSPLDPINDGAKILAQDMLMFIEDNVFDVAFVTGAWTSETTLSGTDQWSDYTNSDPLGDIETAKETISGLTGIAEDELSVAMGAQVWNKLKRHPDLLAQFGGGFGGFKVLNTAQVAEILGVKEVLVSKAVWNTNREGNSTQTLARIIGKVCLVFYKPPTPSLMTPSAGYFFAKTVAESYRWYSNRRRSEVVETSSTFDFKLTCADAGYLVLAAIA